MASYEPVAGQRYQHYTGSCYEVICTAVEESCGTRCVVYRALTDGRCWIRPLAAFGQRVTWKTREGVVCQGPRFALLAAEPEPKEPKEEAGGRVAGRQSSGNPW